MPILMPLGTIDGQRCHNDTRPKQKVSLAVCDFLQLGYSIATDRISNRFWDIKALVYVYNLTSAVISCKCSIDTNLLY